MNVLVIGSGGREHALVWKLSQSERVKSVCCAPGNAGIKKIASCVKISANDVEGLLKYAKKENIDLTIVGPEDALAAGLDALRAVEEFEGTGGGAIGPGLEPAEEIDRLLPRRLPSRSRRSILDSSGIHAKSKRGKRFFKLARGDRARARRP